MASIASSNSATIRSFHEKPISKGLILSPFLTSFPLCKSKFSAIKTGPDGAAAIRSSQEAVDLLRKPSPPAGHDDDENEMKGRDGDSWVDLEDQILEDIMPLVSFVRMMLHSGKYESGDRLIPKYERIILEGLLPYHPKCEKKIGCGVDYITMGTIPILRAQDVYS